MHIVSDSNFFMLYFGWFRYVSNKKLLCIKFHFCIGPTENNIINSTPSHTNKTPNKSPKVGNASIGKYLPYISLFGILGFLIIIRIKSRYKKI